MSRNDMRRLYFDPSPRPIATAEIASHFKEPSSLYLNAAINESME